VLRVRRDNRPEKQKQSSRSGSSNKLHNNRLLQCRLWIGTQTASPKTMFHGIPVSRPDLCGPSKASETVAMQRYGG
jgi:hypothetical protein